MSIEKQEEVSYRLQVGAAGGKWHDWNTYPTPEEAIEARIKSRLWDYPPSEARAVKITRTTTIEVLDQ